jgi:pyridoxamine 5'-phosphate oxidase
MNNIHNYINSLRKDYSKEELDENSVLKDPLLQFQHWFEEALSAKLPDPNAFTLSTVSAEGRPSSRIVLLRSFDVNGFVFYTNYESRKGQELLINKWASLNFFWPELEKQIRIEGEATKVSEEQSEEYFNSRPKESKIGAWASDQSRIIENRNVLSEKYTILTEHYKDNSPPKPPHWGGFKIKPDRFEFWQGRPNRLHDRIAYSLDKSGMWQINRLAP